MGNCPSGELSSGELSLWGVFLVGNRPGGGGGGGAVSSWWGIVQVGVIRWGIVEWGVGPIQEFVNL